MAGLERPTGGPIIRPLPVATGRSLDTALGIAVRGSFWRSIMLTRMVLSLVIAASVCLGLGVASAAADEPKPAAPAGQAEPGKQEQKKDDGKDGAAGGKKDGEGTKQEEKSVTQEPKKFYVKMVTTMGDLVIELDNEKAPISVKNFLSYVDKGFYDGTIFHRVIPNFMIQGGGFTPDMKQKPTDKPIKNEWKNGLKNLRGTLSMARTSDHDSATTQFFLNVVDNSFLDQPRDGAAYAVFGRVIAGMEVADKIVAVPTARKGMHENVPKDAVEIKSVTRMSEADAQAIVKKAEEAAKK